MGGRSLLSRWGEGFFLLLAVIRFFPGVPLQAATFHVNSTTDEVDSNPGNDVYETAVTATGNTATGYDGGITNPGEGS